MFGVHLLRNLLILWSIVTGITVVVAAYRSKLGAEVNDQLFLGAGEDELQRENAEAFKRVKKLAPYVYALYSVSGVLMLCIIGLWLYRGLLMT